MKSYTVLEGLLSTLAVARAVSARSIESAPVSPTLCGVDGVKQLSGYFNVSDAGATDKEYFFWLAESQGSPATDPVVIWLTGGPGCSSTLALFSENGPCKVNDDAVSTTPNPYSWNSRANVVWVDQPAGVGFSYGKAPGDYDHGEDGVGEDMYWFLQELFSAHPEYASNPLYIFGESYGGHYAPAVAHRVWQGNKDGGAARLNIKGMGIGNGLTAPAIQYAFYTEMAVNNSYSIKTVSESDLALMKHYTPLCISVINACQGASQVCATALSYCQDRVVKPFARSGLNPYDIRRQCGHSSSCYDFSHIQEFLRLGSTRQALNVRDDSAPWKMCNRQINSDFSADWMKNFDGLVGPMLDDGLSVLIFAGDADFLCNYMGNEAWTLALDWAGGDGFRAAPQQDWSPTVGHVAGLSRSYGGLTSLRVYNAGHLVPMDQPEIALTMLNNFVHDESRAFQLSAQGDEIIS